MIGTGSKSGSGLIPSPKKIPSISVNKLAEYLESNSAKRKKIIEDAKKPQPFIVTRYKDARDAVREYLKGKNKKIVDAAIATLKKKTIGSDFQEQDRDCSLASLQKLLGIDLSPLNGYDIELYDVQKKYLFINGVRVTVAPDLLVKKTIKDVIHVGAIKVHIIKTNKLSEESQKNVALLLHRYVEKYVVREGQAANSNCPCLLMFSVSPSYPHQRHLKSVGQILKPPVKRLQRDGIVCKSSLCGNIYKAFGNWIYRKLRRPNTQVKYGRPPNPQ